MFNESLEEHCMYAGVSSEKQTEHILEKPNITKRDEVKEITTSGALQLQLMLMLSILLNKKTCKYYILEAINRFT
uniref:Uncharacterized protein n=1 Tax=Glossina austeni TaxID=7395 RepID=A0A1A9UYV9_GLOAU